MNKVNCIMINGIDYLITHRFGEFVYMVDVDNSNNFLIRKIVKKGNGEALALITDEEYNLALEIFAKNVSL